MNAIRHKLKQSIDELLELYEELARLENLLNDNEFEIELSKGLEKASNQRYERLEFIKKEAQLIRIDDNDTIEEFLLSVDGIYQVSDETCNNFHFFTAFVSSDYVPSDGEERLMLSLKAAKFIYERFFRWRWSEASDRELCIARMEKRVQRKERRFVLILIEQNKEKIHEKFCECKSLKEACNLLQL